MSLYKSWLDNLFDGAYVIDDKQTIVYWNKAAENLTGYKASEIVGKACADNILRTIDISGKELCIAGCPFHKTFCDSQPREAIVFMLHKQGHRIPVHIRMSPIKDESGQITAAISIFSDHSRDLHIIQELEHHKKESLLDPLLKIGNRRYAENMFQVRSYEMQMTGQVFAVLFVDIDHFKSINDLYGHSIGDKVLIMVTRTVENLLRHFDTFVRWGGDEFFICLPDVTTPEKLATVCERVRAFVASGSFAVKDWSFAKIEMSTGFLVG